MNAHIQAGQIAGCGSQVIAKCAKNLEFSEKICSCKHELMGTGAVFLRSYGVLFCNECKGLQQIKREVK
ncbi:hypothetical protein D3C77_532590 [compost metagenome]